MVTKCIKCSSCGKIWISEEPWLVTCPSCLKTFDKKDIVLKEGVLEGEKIPLKKNNKLPKDFVKQIDEVTEKLKSKAFK